MAVSVEVKRFDMEPTGRWVRRWKEVVSLTTFDPLAALAASGVHLDEGTWTISKGERWSAFEGLGRRYEVVEVGSEG